MYDSICGGRICRQISLGHLFYELLLQVFPDALENGNELATPFRVWRADRG